MDALNWKGAVVLNNSMKSARCASALEMLINSHHRPDQPPYICLEYLLKASTMNFVPGFSTTYDGISSDVCHTTAGFHAFGPEHSGLVGTVGTTQEFRLSEGS